MYRTSTLSYDTMSYETFHMMLYQYDIHIIVSRENVSYDNHLNFVQCGGWISAVSVTTGHCAFSSHDLNEGQAASVRSAPEVLLHVSPTQFLYEPHIKLTWITLVKRDLIQDDSWSKLWFNRCFVIHTCTIYTLLYIAFTLQFFIV